MNYDDIKKVSAGLKKTDIKGKEYVEVNERVKAFRMLIPDGTIETEILSMDGGVATIKATIKDGDRVLATGIAQEKEGSSFINKTSYIENCETSAVGRALGFLGIGIDTSIASSDEVTNAINNQKTAKDARQEAEQKNANADNKVTQAQLKELNSAMQTYEFTKDDCEKIKAAFGIKKLDELTSAQFDAFLTKVKTFKGAA